MIDIHCVIDRRHAIHWSYPDIDQDTAEQQRFAAMAKAGMDIAVKLEIQAATDAMMTKLVRNRQARRDACCA